jgi:glycerol kinase
MRPTLIALDAGTTGVTAVLFDSDLRPLARSYREFAQRFPRPGWVEHEAPAILAAADRVLGELLEHPRAASAAAIGITNQRETVFALERESGRALRPGIVWQDRRTAERCRALRAAGELERVQGRTGLLIDPYFSATKIEWWLREDEGIRREAESGAVVFATVDALLLAHLCGPRALATEPTNASRTMLYDIERRRWDEGLCELFGLRPEWLPAVGPSSGELGTTLPERTGGRRIAVRGAAGDQQAALFGQGCFDAGSLKATYGTGSFVLLNTGAERVDSRRGLLTTLAVDRRGATCFAIEGSVFVSGAVVQWLRDGLGLVASADEIEALACEVDDTGGVVLVPAFVGLGAPYWDPDARGALLGLTRGSGRAHVARAALEAIAFQIAELIELLREETPFPIEALRADGGAARNDLLMQMQADQAGLRVLRPADVEATARGAAALAGLASGLWSDPEAPEVLREGLREFEPRMDAGERARRLAEWRAAVARVRTGSPDRAHAGP